MTETKIRLFNEHKLYVFAEVMRNQSISKAAQAVFMTQPAVSTIIRQIEEHFDAKLFDIVGRRIQPTTAAEILYQNWLQIEKSYGDLYAAMDDLHHTLRGTIKIAMVSSAKYFIPDIISLFRHKYPEVKFECQIMRREKIIESIETIACDIGILTDPPKHKTINNCYLRDNELVLIAGNNIKIKSTVSLHELASYDFITREKTALITKKIYQLFNDNQLELKVLFAIDSTEAVKQSVISQLGIALVPKISILNEEKHGILKRIKIKNINLTNQWFLTYHQGVKNNKLITAFMETCQISCKSSKLQ